MKGKYVHKSQPKWKDKIYQTAQMSRKYMDKTLKEGKFTHTKKPLWRESMQEESRNEGKVRPNEGKM